MSEAFSPLAERFAECLKRLHPDAPEAVLELAERVCEAVGEGHVCVDLAVEAAAVAALDGCIIGPPGAYTPLILDGTRLYLARYWRYETALARHLRQRAVFCGDVDVAKLRGDLERLFAHNTQQPDWQKAAAAAAVLRRLCVISGGPGTGKTTTVIRLLAALQSQAGGGLRIGLAAPTGKAAARMQDAVRAAKQGLDCEAEVLAAIPETAVTLHRLLGSRPDSVYFRYNAEHPLPLDVLVVDEASMIDLALMAKLLDALPSTCRLILLGDKDQLASVEAGAVFGDICGGGEYSAAMTALLEQAGCRGELVRRGGEHKASKFAPTTESPLADSIMLLRHSHRFAADSGVGALAALCNQGQAEQALALLSRGGEGISWRQGRYGEFKDELLKRTEQGYAGHFAAVADGADPAAVFAAFNRFRVLTAHREGDCGAENLNRWLEERIKARLNLHYRSVWYPGRAVMIARNDYNLRLFNGDIGIALKQAGQLRVFFEDAEGRVRGLAPGRLPEHRPVYAMTVHKSQGSEFEEVLLLLPDATSAVLNRPLIYTAITRAKRAVEVWGLAEVLARAVATAPQRASGLRERLWAC